MELQQGFLSDAAGLEHPGSFDVIENPLNWQLACVIYDECISRARQGTLYISTSLDCHSPEGNPSVADFRRHFSVARVAMCRALWNFRQVLLISQKYSALL
jgi:hypothetical protein